MTVEKEQVTPPSRRDRLLTAALEEFGEKSYDLVSVSAIADAAGVAHGLPFHYFGSKHGLYLAAVERLTIDLRTVHSVSSGLPPRTAIRRFLRQHVEYFEGRPHALLDLMRSGLGADPDVRATFDAARWDGAAQMLELLGIDADHPVVRALVRAWLAYADELILQWLISRPFSKQRLIDVVLAGLAQSLDSVRLIDKGIEFDARGLL